MHKLKTFEITHNNDLNKDEVHKYNTNNKKIITKKADFICYALENDEKYDLIIGNPPYIAKKNLSVEDRENQIKFTEFWNLPSPVFQNIWVSFVLASIKLLNIDDGAIFFVLPFEFLQVQYAQKLRNFLEEKFN